MVAATQLDPSDLALVKRVLYLEARLDKVRRNPEEYEDGVQTDLRNDIRRDKKELTGLARKYYDEQSKILSKR